MKKNLISLCALALSFVALSSCDRADEGTTQTVKFKVLSEVATKTHLVEGKTNWSKDDVIHVLGADGVYYKSDAITKSGVEASEFIFSSFPQTPQYALYVGRTQKPVVEDGNISATLPSDQNMSVSHSFCNHANLTIGEVVKVDESTYGSTLKNVCGLLKVTVPSGITSVKIEGNDEETLSGAIYIDYNAGEPTWSAKEGENFVNIIPRVNSEGTYVGSDYYACVLPQTFENGITVTLTDINGNTAVTAGSNPLTLGRNKVVELPNLNIPKEPATILEFDFTSKETYPESFPITTTNSSSYPDGVEFKAIDGNCYTFKFAGKSCIYKSSDVGLCIYERQKHITLPVIEGKKISSIKIICGNSSSNQKTAKAYERDGSYTDWVLLNPEGNTAGVTILGSDLVSLYTNASTTILDNLVLVYE